VKALTQRALFTDHSGRRERRGGSPKSWKQLCVEGLGNDIRGYHIASNAVEQRPRRQRLFALVRLTSSPVL